MRSAAPACATPLSALAGCLGTVAASRSSSASLERGWGGGWDCGDHRDSNPIHWEGSPSRLVMNLAPSPSTPTGRDGASTNTPVVLSGLLCWVARAGTGSLSCAGTGSLSSAQARRHTLHRRRSRALLRPATHPHRRQRAPRALLQPLHPCPCRARRVGPLPSPHGAAASAPPATRCLLLPARPCLPPRAAPRPSPRRPPPSPQSFTLRID